MGLETRLYNTVYIWIVVVATVNFSLAGVRLLIEGSSYSRVAFINLRAISPSAIHKKNNAKDRIMRTALQIFVMWLNNKHPRCCRTKQRIPLPCFCLELTIIHRLRSWSYPLHCVRTCVWLLFEGSYNSGCSFYSNKYGIHTCTCTC